MNSDLKTDPVNPNNTTVNCFMVSARVISVQSVEPPFQLHCLFPKPLDLGLEPEKLTWGLHRLHVFDRLLAARSVLLLLLQKQLLPQLLRFFQGILLLDLLSHQLDLQGTQRLLKGRQAASGLSIPLDLFTKVEIGCLQKIDPLLEGLDVLLSNNVGEFASRLIPPLIPPAQFKVQFLELQLHGVCLFVDQTESLDFNSQSADVGNVSLLPFSTLVEVTAHERNLLALVMYMSLELLLLAVDEIDPSDLSPQGGQLLLQYLPLFTPGHFPQGDLLLKSVYFCLLYRDWFGLAQQLGNLVLRLYQLLLQGCQTLIRILLDVTVVAVPSSPHKTNLREKALAFLPPSLLSLQKLVFQGSIEHRFLRDLIFKGLYFLFDSFPVLLLLRANSLLNYIEGLRVAEGTGDRVRVYRLDLVLVRIHIVVRIQILQTGSNGFAHVMVHREGCPVVLKLIGVSNPCCRYIVDATHSTNFMFIAQVITKDPDQTKPALPTITIRGIPDCDENKKRDHNAEPMMRESSVLSLDLSRLMLWANSNNLDFDWLFSWNSQETQNFQETFLYFGLTGMLLQVYFLLFIMDSMMFDLNGLNLRGESGTTYNRGLLPKDCREELSQVPTEILVIDICLREDALFRSTSHSVQQEVIALLVTLMVGVALPVDTLP